MCYNRCNCCVVSFSDLSLLKQNCTTQKIMHNFLDRLNNVTEYAKLHLDTRDKNFISAFGVQPNEKPLLVSGAKGCALYVCSDYVESQRVFRELSALTDGNVVYLPHKEDVLLYKRTASKNQLFARNFALYNLVNGANYVVTCIDSLMQFYPLKSRFQADCFRIQTGVCYDVKLLIKQLVACGFVRVDGISAEGEFAVRGDILDISLPFGKRYRVDFFDDEVESIKVVGDDNLARESVDFIDIYPLYEATLLNSAKLDDLQGYINRQKVSENAKARLQEIISQMQSSAGNGMVDNAWLVPFVKCSTLAEYLPANTVVFWDEPKLLLNRVNFITNEHNQRVENLTKAGEVLPVHQKCLVDAHNVFAVNKRQVSLQTLPYAPQIGQPDVVYNFKTTAVPNYAMNDTQLATDVSNWKRIGYEVVILAGKDGVEPTCNKLATNGVYLHQGEKALPNPAEGLILPIGYSKGFVSHTNKLVVIGARDLGRGIDKKQVSKNKKQAFLSVERGDYVVHEVHGIGLCEGIQKITSPSGEQKDYIVVLYKNGDRLYVPVDSTNMLSRYSGGENPTLSKLGGEDFARVKNKVKAGIKQMSIDLLKLYAEREKSRGFRYHIDQYLNDEFEQYFPFTPTEDQLKCQTEIAKDLTSDRIMDRVLVGDVGFGKTEVAMRATFDVVSNGYQVAVLAPTTILAEQHYKTFSERMAHFDIKVACLNRFRSAEEQKNIVKQVAEGKVDVLVGTHRLLSKDVQFAKLGLLVLDEEQRFGVEHKEKIKALKTSVDVLTMSATPIPRTLHMALSGIRDISTITTPPVERMAVETFVVEQSDTLLCDVITRELARGGQVYCVYNSVQTIDSFAYKLKEMLPDAKIIVAHGQMGETALEDAVLAFAQGKGNVLVCTTIIENGIDIPNANTIIVTNADKLGLSQLYQLRGRVGRSNKLAYAYFLYKEDKILSEVAFKRLSSITEYSELGSGFKIAMKDLEIRGAGNILGREQHGHMVKVGYDMYAKLLQEAIAELKGKPVEKEVATEIEIDIEAYAPDNYIPSQTERMDFYQQLAGCKTVEEIDKTKQQLQNVYGTMPRSVENLFTVATLKVLANAVGVQKVVVKVGKGELVFASKEKMFCKSVFDALTEFGNRVSASSNSYSLVFSSTDYIQKDRLLDAMLNFLQILQQK